MRQTWIFSGHLLLTEEVERDKTYQFIFSENLDMGKGDSIIKLILMGELTQI